MTKKFIIGLLVTVVFAGLGVFAYNQVAAQPPPTDAERIIRCTDVNEAVRLSFENGGLAAAYWCETWTDGTCCTYVDEICVAGGGTGENLNKKLVLFVMLILQIADLCKVLSCYIGARDLLGAALGEVAFLNHEALFLGSFGCAPRVCLYFVFRREKI